MISSHNIIRIYLMVFHALTEYPIRESIKKLFNYFHAFMIEDGEIGLD